MTQPDRFQSVRQALRANSGGGAVTPECLSDDTMAALAEGTLGAPERAEALAHVWGCARCRNLLASLARALSDSGVTREIAAVEGGGRRRFYRVALPLAAAAVLLLILVRPGSFENGTHRGPPAAAVVPVPVAPIGIVASATPLEWTAVAGADRYRVTLSDAAGRLLYEFEVTDTVASLPDSIPLVAGRSYVWLVEARTGFNRWSTSRLVEFSIGGAATP